MSNNPLRAGLIPLHIMYHAAKGEIFGQGMIDELRHLGYHIGPSTLYPMLHRLEERVGRTMRRLYRATPKGRAAIQAVKPQVQELFEELIKGHEPGHHPRRPK